jgi:hypothetical protein
MKSLWIWGIPVVLIIIVVGFVGAGKLLPTTIAWNSNPTETATSTPTFILTRIPKTPSSTPILITPEATTPSVVVNTPSPLPTTPLPKATTPSPDSIIPTPTNTFTATPIPKAQVIAVNGLNLRSGPGVVYDIIGFLNKGDNLIVKGFNANNNWVQVIVVKLGIEGWVSTDSNLVQISGDLTNIPIVKNIPPSPTPIPAPKLISPQDGFESVGDRPDLIWGWGDITQKEDYYYEVTIWLQGQPNPIDVAWVQYPCYRYDQIPEGKEGQIWTFWWTISVVKGTPGKLKQWSPVQSCNYWRDVSVWDPGLIKETRKISEISEWRSVKVIVQSPTTSDPLPIENNNNNDDGGGGGDGGGCPRC